MHSLQIHDKTLIAFLTTDVHELIYLVCTHVVLSLVVMVPVKSNTTALLEDEKNGLIFLGGDQ